MGVMVLLVTVIGFLVIALVIWLNTPRETGSVKKELRLSMRQNNEMRALLNRIASDNVGSPQLEAQLLLEKITNDELKELK